MIESIVQTTVLNSLVVVVGAIAVWVAARSGLRPAWVHLLWLALLLRLVMPPVWPLDFRLPLEWADRSPAGARAAAGGVAAAASLEWLPKAMVNPTIDHRGAAASALTRPSGTVPSTIGMRWWTRVWAATTGWPWMSILGAVWVAGALAWWTLAWRRLLGFQRALGHGESVRSVTCEAAGVPLWLIDVRLSPCLWAFAGRARIVFPRALYESLPVVERELILRHELAHYHRRDHWVRWIEFVVLGLHWWNPLAWWISQQLRVAEEAACDAQVAAATPDERRAYATALVRTAEFLLVDDAWRAPRLASGASGLDPLKHRLRRILQATPPPHRPALAWILLGSTGVALAVTPIPHPPAAEAEASRGSLVGGHQTIDEVPRALPVRDDEPIAAPETESPTAEATDDPPPATPLKLMTGAEREAPPAAGSEGVAHHEAADSKPEHVYLKGYMRTQEASKFQSNGWMESAAAAYREALEYFDEVAETWPEWHPKMVANRRALTSSHLAALASALGTARTYVSSKERVAAARVVTSFLAADTIDARLPWVRFGEAMRARLESWHQIHPLQPEMVVDDVLAESLSKWIEVDGLRFLVVTVPLARTRAYQIFALQESQHGFKIDWETAVRWQPVPLADFRSGRAESPQTFRVQASPGDYYNGLFADQSEWQCVALSYPGDADFNLFGYVRRDSPTGRRLAAALKDAASRPLILELSRPADAAENQVFIDRLVHRHWFLKDGPLPQRSP